MSRWKVAQHVRYRSWLAYPASYDSEQPESNMDDDLPRQPLGRGFRKWQDALAYADRMARTREYVLPRPQARFSKETAQWWVGSVVIASSPSETDTALISYPGKLIRVMKRDLRPLALALLALAEQGEQCGK